MVVAGHFFDREAVLFLATGFTQSIIIVVKFALPHHETSAQVGQTEVAGSRVERSAVVGLCCVESRS